MCRVYIVVSVDDVQEDKPGLESALGAIRTLQGVLTTQDIEVSVVAFETTWVPTSPPAGRPS